MIDVDPIFLRVARGDIAYIKFLVAPRSEEH